MTGRPTDPVPPPPGVGRGTPGRPTALVVTVSTRAAAGVYADRSGPVLAEGLSARGFLVDGPVVVPDGEGVEAVLRDAVARGIDVVLTTGGTGLAPSDVTPEMTRRVLEREVPGVAEEIRRRGAVAGVSAAVLSRGLAGTAGGTFVVNVAGSTGACRDAMAVLAGVLEHGVQQLHGEDHGSRPPAGT